jgi:hypothetical protein
MNGTYACLERYVYAGLEAFTYGQMEACVVEPIEVSLIFSTCRPRQLALTSTARPTQFDLTQRNLRFVARSV